MLALAWMCVRGSGEGCSRGCVGETQGIFGGMTICAARGDGVFCCLQQQACVLGDPCEILALC
jgi:hypothetical protein